MWSIVDLLLGRGHRACDGVSADDLSTFMKVNRMRSTTSGSSPPTFRPAPTSVAFTEFAILAPEDVTAAITRLPDKSPTPDPLPVLTLNGVSDTRTISDSLV